MCTSDSTDAKKCTDQVLAIYPILPGQMKDGANPIPPRAAESKPGANKSSESKQTPAQPAQPAHDDLIDFSQDDSPAEAARPAAVPSTIDSRTESTGEISGLLKSTGKPSEGPLIDFHNDLKKNIPSIPRAGSNDFFVDAKE